MRFPATRSRYYYIIDVESYVYYTSVTEKSSVFGVEIDRTFLTDYIHKDDIDIFLDRLRLTMIKGSEVCTVRVGSRLLLMKLKKLSDRRIKAERWDITGMGAEAFDMI